MKITDDLSSTYIHDVGEAEQLRLEAQVKLLVSADFLHHLEPVILSIVLSMRALKKGHK